MADPMTYTEFCDYENSNAYQIDLLTLLLEVAADSNSPAKTNLSRMLQIFRERGLRMQEDEIKSLQRAGYGDCHQ